MDDDENEEIGRKLSEAAKRRRGHADFFDWPNKETKEWGIARNLADSLAQYEETFFTSVTSRPQGSDPPDCELVDTEQRRYGVEITELVDQEVIEHVKRTAEVYCSTEWHRDRLLTSLEKIVERKDKPFKDPPYFRRVLLIHTDEPELEYDAASRILGEHKFRKPSNFDDAILFFSYSPKQKGYRMIRLKFDS